MIDPALQLGPIAFPVGKSLTIGVVSLLHIAFASLAVGYIMLTPLAEALGRTRPHFTELAHAMAQFTLVTYTTSLVLAVIMIELFIGLFPLTNAWLFNQFRLPIGIAIAAFLLQLFLLYPYYHYWEALRARSVRLHIWMGLGTAVFVLIWVGVLDAIGSFMLTPAKDGRAAVMNPSFVPLVLHRFFGNLVLAGYMLAGYGGWMLRRRPEHEAPYYAHMCRIGMLVGALALLLQPLTGLLYAQSIERAVPDAYGEIVAGRYQPLAYLQFTLVGLLFLGTVTWMRLTQAPASQTYWPWVFAIVALCMVASVGHPTLRRIWTMALVFGTAWLLYAQGTPLAADLRLMARPPSRWMAAGLAVLALGTYLTMGTIRETARHPDTVRGLISLQEDGEIPASDWNRAVNLPP